MFTDPDTESAGVAGVGTLVTSTREMLLIEICSSVNVRSPPEFAMGAPSLVTKVMLALKPRTEIAPGSNAPPPVSIPGTNFRNSPMFPPITSPIESVDTTFLRFGAKRWSLIAIAALSVSLVAATRNGSSRTAASFTPKSAWFVRPMSWVTVWPAVTCRATR